MDSIYVSEKDKAIYLDCTRKNNSKDLISRNKLTSIDVDNQIETISNLLKENNTKEIILFDDVVFSGSVLKKIINKLKENDIEVIGIRTCIATNESFEYFNKNLKLGLDCGYKMDDRVIDQICERDFYFGIAQSGILTENEKGMICKAPYFKPFGNPCERASIPKEYEIEFSKECIKRSILLWSEIEKLSDCKFYIKNLPERINYTDLNSEVVKTLKKEDKLL